MRRFICGFALALSACTGQPSDQPQPSKTTAATTPPKPPVPPTATASASASGNGARAVSEETDDFLFEYSYPKQAGRIPALAEALDRRLERTRASLAAESTSARLETREDGFPYNKHSTQVKWETVAEIPGWLSLSADVASYSGGAHGNYGFDSLVWDKERGRGYRGIDLFRSPDVLGKALGEKLCQALDTERAKRRGTKAGGSSVTDFDKCVPVKDATVLLGSRSKRKFDRITVQYGPYAAGPYAEGAYELDFTVDRAALDAVKPEFRDAFAARN